MKTRPRGQFPLVRALPTWLVACLALCAACAAPAEDSRYRSVVISASGEDREALERELPPDLLAMFDRLQELVFAHEDRAARNVLARIQARRPDGRALEMAEAFDRILDGRALVEAVRLELAIQAHERDPSRYRVALFAHNGSQLACVLRPGPATLMLEQTMVDREGRERRNETTRATDEFLELPLAAGESVTVPLLEFARPLGVDASPDAPSASMQSTLAARYTWDLRLLSGVFEVDGVRLPAMRFDVQPAERVWLAASLPSEVATPEELLEAMRLTTTTKQDLMAIAVRVPGEERTRTLSLVQAELDRLPSDRWNLLTPALRWISGDSRLGNDPAAWRAWTAGLAAGSASEENRGLDLPKAPR